MFFRYNLFGIIWIVIILLLGVTPGKSMPLTNLWDLLSFDKAAHFMVFSVLCFLLIIGFTKQYAYLFFRFNAVKLAVGFSFVFGLLIELCQGFIPGRGLEFWDMVANSLGAFSGMGIFYLIYKV